MEYRPYYLAREWVKLGHSVTIVAASFSHVRQKNITLSGKYLVEIIDGIHYVWLRTPPYFGNGFDRIKNMICFLRGLFFLLPRTGAIQRPDLVIASSTYPLDIFPAFLLARKAGATLVFEVHDLWPLSPKELGNMSKYHPYILVMQAAEDFACRKSDFVVSLLPKANIYLQTRGMSPGKFVYIPNGVCLDEYETLPASIPEPHLQALSRIREQGHSIVCYAGAHGLANNLETLIEAAGLLRGSPVSFVLVGQGPEKQRLQSTASSRGLKNVLFLPPVPKNALANLIQQVDMLYFGLKNSLIFRYGISPNKLFDYMAAAKPIIYAVQAANDPVADSACGISVPPENPQAVAEAIIRLVSMSSSDLSRMGLRGRTYVVENHDYRKLAVRFLASVRGCSIPWV